MKSAKECHAKAAELVEKAKLAPTPESRAEYLDMAAGWRAAADMAVAQAKWRARIIPMH